MAPISLSNARRKRNWLLLLQDVSSLHKLLGILRCIWSIKKRRGKMTKKCAWCIHICGLHYQKKLFQEVFLQFTKSFFVTENVYSNYFLEILHTYSSRTLWKNTVSQSNKQLMFKQMLRSARNEIEYSVGRLKVRWWILIWPLGVPNKFLPDIVYTCFVL